MSALESETLADHEVTHEILTSLRLIAEALDYFKDNGILVRGVNSEGEAINVRVEGYIKT